jgi:hypothetical protein
VQFAAMLFGEIEIGQHIGRTPGSGTDLPSGPLVQLAGRRCKGWLPNTGIQVFEHIEFPDTAGPLQLLRPGS